MDDDAPHQTAVPPRALARPLAVHAAVSECPHSVHARRDLDHGELPVREVIEQEAHGTGMSSTWIGVAVGQSGQLGD